MHKAGASALVVEAGKAIVFNRDEMIDLANNYGITVLARRDRQNVNDG
jgi:DUF1009 family protein